MRHTSPPHGAIRGALRELVYLGSGHRAEVLLRDGTCVVARTPVDRRDAGLTPGDEVLVTWDREHCLVIADRAQGPRVPVGA